LESLLQFRSLRKVSPETVSKETSKGGRFQGNETSLVIRENSHKRRINENE
jgi:hypothetical protein